MTPQQIEAMKLALEALKWCHGGEPCGTAEAITAIEEALAQPEDPCKGANYSQAREQEPVAYTTGHCENHKQKGGCQLHNLQCGWPDCDRKPITTPPQRTWVGLTDEEIGTIAYNVNPLDGIRQFSRAIEAKLKEKNT